MVVICMLSVFLYFLISSGVVKRLIGLGRKGGMNVG